MNDSESELAWFRTLFDAMEDALFVHDLEGRILECNAAGCSHTGYTRDEILRMRTSDFDAPDFAAGFTERLRKQLAHKRYRCEGIHLSKDGTPINVDIHTTLIDYRGQPAILAVMRDITERKRAELEREALRTRVAQAEKLESLGVMAGGIAHDFNNLLMGVLGNANIAMLEAPEDSRMRQCLEQIESAAQRAANLSQQMLAYSGRATFALERLDMRQLLRDAAPALASTIAKHHRIEYRFDGEPAIYADESQLRQVLLGLVNNATEAYGDGEGVVTVSVGVEHVEHVTSDGCYVTGPLTDEAYAVLEVNDAGSGMDERVVERIFDPFFTTKFTGRGLGLAAVIGIVRGHRGAISVRSAVGEGSTFRVYLPLATSGAADLKRTPLAGGAATGQGVLLVDDEETILHLSRYGLERAGFTVFTASSGKQAVAIFREHSDKIGLVVLDMTMPRMSGEETFRALKAVRGDVRVVLSSGYSRVDAESRFDAGAFVDFLPKPYHSRDLVRIATRILRPPGVAELASSTDFQI